MTDVRLKNGDIARGTAGRFERLSDADARFQRALICIAAKKGSFIYDRGLGSRLDLNSGGEFAKENAEFVINEALAKYDGTRARVLELGETLKVEIVIDGESRTEEVRFYGSVQ